MSRTSRQARAAAQHAVPAEGQSRVYFQGNPWPSGHALTAVEFSIEICAAGPTLFAYLESESYDAADTGCGSEPDADGDETTDWESKLVWNNFHKCRLEPEGMPLRPFDLSAFLAGVPLAADPDNTLDEDEGYEFYLLGFDSVRDHVFTVQRVRNRGEGALGADTTIDVDWSAAIAHTYVGETEFSHRMVAKLRGVPFRGVQVSAQGGASGALPDDDVAPQDAAVAFAQRYMMNPQQLGVVTEGGECWLVPRRGPADREG